MGNYRADEVVSVVDGRSLKGYLAIPEQPGPGVLVLHAWWGLNPFFRQLCDRLAEAGFLAFAPDLNHGQLAITIEAAQKLMDARNFEATGAAVFDSLRYLQGQAGRLGDTLVVIGFSMGASWALVLAAEKPEAVSAGVLFYGVEGVDFSKVRADFMGHFGMVDTWTKVDWANQMEVDMRAAGLHTEFYRYPDAGHWFFESDRPEDYRAEDARRAWERTLTFLSSRWLI